MGLTTAYSIIRKHGGHIGVASRQGEGTTFTIYLPVATGAPAAAPAPDTARVVPGEHRLLVLDDDPTIRILAQRILEKEGFRVEGAAEGAEAVQLFRAAQTRGEPFSAAILDITIPGGMGGRETLAELKKMDPRFKALVSSGYSTDAIMAAPHEFGFAGCVSKPYRAPVLLAEIRRILAR
jgi:CheY-like chemotaxis protein